MRQVESKFASFPYAFAVETRKDQNIMEVAQRNHQWFKDHALFNNRDYVSFDVVLQRGRNNYSDVTAFCYAFRDKNTAMMFKLANA